MQMREDTKDVDSSMAGHGLSPNEYAMLGTGAQTLRHLLTVTYRETGIFPLSSAARRICLKLSFDIVTCASGVGYFRLPSYLDGL